MSNMLYLFVGKSASGKSTIANMLEEQYGHKQVWSYTTRPRRCEDEKYHIFINDEEFDQLDELAAYTEYNGFRYGTTWEQLGKCSIYVIDVPGIEALLQNMGERDLPICIIYFDAAVATRIMRMIGRDASDHEIISRLLADDTTNDWYRQLDKLTWHYKNIESKQIQLHRIDANEDVENVLSQVLYYINENNEME